MVAGRNPNFWGFRRPAGRPTFAPVKTFVEPPAPGYRYRDSGTLHYVGQSGFSWSSLISGSYARYLDFSYGGITPQGSNPRANGFLVRCLQE